MLRSNLVKANKLNNGVVRELHLHMNHHDIYYLHTHNKMGGLQEKHISC